MKLNNQWPSSFHWILQFSGCVAYIQRYTAAPEEEREALREAVSASDVRVSVETDGEYNLQIDMKWSALRNDERVIKALGYLRERYGMFDFKADLVARSNNETWDALVAYYQYNPAKYTGIRRTYLSCAECAFLCRFCLVEEIYPVFDKLLLLRDQENLQQVGGILYVDFQNHPVINKRSVLLESPAEADDETR